LAQGMEVVSERSMHAIHRAIRSKDLCTFEHMLENTAS